MKKMKSKIATALVLGAISFGMFSFTTTPINAQVTTSQISSAETDAEAGFLSRLGRLFIRGLVAGAGLDYLIGDSGNSINYPDTVLD